MYTIKAAEPLFIFTLSYILLQKSYPTRTLLACLPIVIGVSLATVTELSFSPLALFFALFSNVAVALRNLLSKGQAQTHQQQQSFSSGDLKDEERDGSPTVVDAESTWVRIKMKEEMNGHGHGGAGGKVFSAAGTGGDSAFNVNETDSHSSAISIFSPLELFTISSFLAMWFILPIWGLVSLMVSMSSESTSQPTTTTTTSSPTPSPSSSSPFSSSGVNSDLFLGAGCHFLYTLFSFQVLSQISPLSHAITNVSKRLVTIVASWIVFRNPVTVVQVLGILVAHGGVGWFLYLKAITGTSTGTTGTTAGQHGISSNMSNQRYGQYKRCSSRSSDSRSGSNSEDDESMGERRLLPERFGGVRGCRGCERRAGGAGMSMGRKADMWIGGLGVVLVVALLVSSGMGVKKEVEPLSELITKVDWDLQSSIHSQEPVEDIKSLLSELITSQEHKHDGILWEYDGTPSKFSQDMRSNLTDLAKPPKHKHEQDHHRTTLSHLSKMLSQALQQQHNTRHFNRIQCIRNIQHTISTTIKSIIDPERDPVLLMSVPEHWNLGDSFISAGSLALFNDFQPGVVPLPCTETDCVNHFENITNLLNHHGPNSVLFFQGGGNFGDLWRWSQSERNAFVQNFTNTRIVFGPQSVHYENKTVLQEDVAIFSKHEKLTMLFRDWESIRIMRDAG
ncbi:hypothetical protein HK102_005230, partial [Quaeritorhiza haematococci]